MDGRWSLPTPAGLKEQQLQRLQLLVVYGVLGFEHCRRGYVLLRVLRMLSTPLPLLEAPRVQVSPRAQALFCVMQPAVMPATPLIFLTITTMRDAGEEILMPAVRQS